MPYYGKIDFSEAVDPNKTNSLKECITGHYIYFFR